MAEAKLVSQAVTLVDVTERIDLLITDVFGVSYPIRMAHPPPHPTLLTFVFDRHRGPVPGHPIPATDGASLWLPADLGISDKTLALQRYRTMALQQAMRAHRGSADALTDQATTLHRDIYLLVEATAADEALVTLLPDIAASINELRTAALAARPLMSAFPKYLRPLETFVRILLRSDCSRPPDPALRSTSPTESTHAAERIVASLMPIGMATRCAKTKPLLKDWWTGELRPRIDIATADDCPSLELTRDAGDCDSLKKSR